MASPVELLAFTSPCPVRGVYYEGTGQTEFMRREITDLPEIIFHKFMHLVILDLINIIICCAGEITIADIWLMRLYIAGETESSKHAINNLRDICDEYLKDRCEIEVIDLKKHPELAAKREIFAIPTLVKELPLPVRKLIGDLHATQKVLAGLDLSRKPRPEK